MGGETAILNIWVNIRVNEFKCGRTSRSGPPKTATNYEVLLKIHDVHFVHVVLADPQLKLKEIAETGISDEGVEHTLHEIFGIKKLLA